MKTKHRKIRTIKTICLKGGNKSKIIQRVAQNGMELEKFKSSMMIKM